MLTIYKNNAQDQVLTQIVNNLYNSGGLLEGSIEDPHAIAAGMQELLSGITKMYLEGKDSKE